jgi:hypothetical protein
MSLDESKLITSKTAERIAQLLVLTVVLHSVALFAPSPTCHQRFNPRQQLSAAAGHIPAKGGARLIGRGAVSSENSSLTSVYKHGNESVQRPDSGVEAQFKNTKMPKTYRYDSSLAPELSWDESAERAFAEWLLAVVSEAAEKGVATVFANPQVWQGNGESFTSLSECVARLRSLTKPFLNWTGKAERQQVKVPTLPLFVHERHSTQAILETLKSHKALGTNLARLSQRG